MHPTQTNTVPSPVRSNRRNAERARRVPHAERSRSSKSRCAGPGTFLLGLAAAAALAAPALAQLAYSEPPDLAGGPSSLISLSPPAAVGLNTVRGGLFAVWNGLGPMGDSQDWFAFDVPGGLAVTGIDVVVSGYACGNCIARVRLDGSAVATIPGDGTLGLTLPGGTLGEGTHVAAVTTGPVAAGLNGSSFLTYEFRITVVRPDDCALARAVGLGVTNFNTSNATADGPEHPECDSRGFAGIDRDTWFTFTPAIDGRLTADTCASGFDTKLAAYQGASCDQLTHSLLVCNDDSDGCGPGSTQSVIQLDVTAGQTYLLRVGGFRFSGGPGALNLALTTIGACCNRATGGCAALTSSDCGALGCDFLGFGIVCRPFGCPPCPADFNRSGTVSVQDIFDFLAAYFAGCP